VTAPIDVPYDCAQQGHVWLEADGTPYARSSDRPRGPVAVTCEYCGASATLEGHGAFTAPPKVATDLAPRLTFAQNKVLKANVGPVKPGAN
jgi:hypothetical protein